MQGDYRFHIIYLGDAGSSGNPFKIVCRARTSLSAVVYWLCRFSLVWEEEEEEEEEQTILVRVTETNEKEKRICKFLFIHSQASVCHSRSLTWAPIAKMRATIPSWFWSLSNRHICPLASSTQCASRDGRGHHMRRSKRERAGQRCPTSKQQSPSILIEFSEPDIEKSFVPDQQAASQAPLGGYWNQKKKKKKLDSPYIWCSLGARGTLDIHLVLHRYARAEQPALPASDSRNKLRLVFPHDRRITQIDLITAKQHSPIHDRPLIPKTPFPRYMLFFIP